MPKVVSSPAACRIGVSLKRRSCGRDRPWPRHLASDLIVVDYSSETSTPDAIKSPRMRQATGRGDENLAVLVDFDIDALVLGDLARKSWHVDLQDLPVLPLIEEIGEHAEPDHGRTEQEGEHRTEAFHGLSPLLR